MQAPSFDQAAHTYARAVGGRISGDSVRRLTEGFGQGVAEKRQAEVAGAYDLRAGEAPGLTVVDALDGQGNVSTDGVMMLVCEEGWKEVKLTVWSQCAASEDPERRVQLSRHSCQAGLWDADTMARYQYVEGLRCGAPACARLGSVNDAAAWILRCSHRWITADNFPQAALIVDWPHAQGRVWQVAHSLFGEGTEAARRWAETQVERLWQGRRAEIIAALADFPHSAEARRARAYFTQHLGHMDYGRYRDQGYPIGSGTVESGCKNCVQRRMKRSGRGWGRDTGQAMLSALSELHSDRFDRVWQACA
ncbi:MAG: hypothetical protein GXY79_10665 [Chloroflexi bacterium]|nr:hypothetical protein [Chloroflexota bacterium]